MNSSSSEYFWSECDPYGEDDGTFSPSEGLLIFLITVSFEFLISAPSNLWLLCHILRQRSKVTGITPADFFPFHLALIQLAFFLLLPTFFANHLLWQSNNVLILVSFLNSLMLIMKPLLLCLVCVERYMAVVRPLDYLRLKSRRYRWGCLAVSWCIDIIMASSAVFKRSFITIWVVFLPVLVIDSFCSLSILKALKKTPPGDRVVKDMETGEKRGKTCGTRMEEVEQRKEGKTDKKVRKVAGSELRRKGEMNSMKRKAFVTIAIIQAVITLNYLPIIITLPMDGRVPARTLKCQYQALGLAAAASCGYLQPLLYLYRLGRLPCVTRQNT